MYFEELRWKQGDPLLELGQPAGQRADAQPTSRAYNYFKRSATRRSCSASMPCIRLCGSASISKQAGNDFSGHGVRGVHQAAEATGDPHADRHGEQGLHRLRSREREVHVKPRLRRAHPGQREEDRLRRAAVQQQCRRWRERHDQPVEQRSVLKGVATHRHERFAGREDLPGRSAR